MRWRSENCIIVASVTVLSKQGLQRDLLAAASAI
jgi:hypothetical protein